MKVFLFLISLAFSLITRAECFASYLKCFYVDNNRFFSLLPARPRKPLKYSDSGYEFHISICNDIGYIPELVGRYIDSPLGILVPNRDKAYEGSLPFHSSQISFSLAPGSDGSEVTKDTEAKDIIITYSPQTKKKKFSNLTETIYTTTFHFVCNPIQMDQKLSITNFEFQEAKRTIDITISTRAACIYNISAITPYITPTLISIIIFVIGVSLGLSGVIYNNLWLRLVGVLLAIPLSIIYAYPLITWSMAKFYYIAATILCAGIGYAIAYYLTKFCHFLLFTVPLYPVIHGITPYLVTLIKRDAAPYKLDNIISHFVAIVVCAVVAWLSFRNMRIGLIGSTSGIASFLTVSSLLRLLDMKPQWSCDLPRNTNLFELLDEFFGGVYYEDMRRSLLLWVIFYAIYFFLQNVITKKKARAELQRAQARERQNTEASLEVDQLERTLI